MLTARERRAPSILEAIVYVNPRFAEHDLGALHDLIETIMSGTPVACAEESDDDQESLVV